MLFVFPPKDPEERREWERNLEVDLREWRKRGNGVVIEGNVIEHIGPEPEVKR